MLQVKFRKQSHLQSCSFSVLRLLKAIGPISSLVLGAISSSKMWSCVEYGFVSACSAQSLRKARRFGLSDIARNLIFLCMKNHNYLGLQTNIKHFDNFKWFSKRLWQWFIYYAFILDTNRWLGYILYVTRRFVRRLYAEFSRLHICQEKLMLSSSKPAIGPHIFRQSKMRGRYTVSAVHTLSGSLVSSYS